MYRKFGVNAKLMRDRNNCFVFSYATVLAWLGNTENKAISLSHNIILPVRYLMRELGNTLEFTYVVDDKHMLHIYIPSVFLKYIYNNSLAF